MVYLYDGITYSKFTINVSTHTIIFVYISCVKYVGRNVRTSHSAEWLFTECLYGCITWDVASFTLIRLH